MKASACKGLLSGTGITNRLTMPLMPAMRPLKSIIRTAAAPISAPPAADASGVNSVSMAKDQPFLDFFVKKGTREEATCHAKTQRARVTPIRWEA